jgi:galactokinase
MSTPTLRAVAAFRDAYGRGPTRIARAPGRVNLIGEHTDYNDGFVLPCAIDFETAVAAGPGEGPEVSVVAADFGGATDRFRIDAPIARVGEWRDYVRGMAVVLGEDGPLEGCELAVAGDVPPGSGLSSSAALEIAVGSALLEMAGRSMAPHELAKAGQRAENAFVGSRCGIMDQLISARGKAGHALLIDCRSLACTPVAMPQGVSVVIVNSGVRHSNVGGEYNDRRAQCEAAARHYGVAALRDLDEAALEAGKQGLDETTFRRARHVVTENARTLAAAEALRGGELRRMGELMAASHASMRDDFEITVPPIDDLVEIVDGVLAGEGGARMTGGGFGGCVVALAPDGAVEAVRRAVTEGYRTPDGNPPLLYVCTAAPGAEVFDWTG